MAVSMWVLNRLGNKSDFENDRQVFKMEAEPETTYLLGRGRRNNIVLSSLLVSRKHCEFLIHHKHLYVKDLGGENGTFINGSKIRQGTPARLRPGDELGLGVLQYNDKDSYLFKVAVERDDETSDESDDEESNSESGESESPYDIQIDEARVSTSPCLPAQLTSDVSDIINTSRETNNTTSIRSPKRPREEGSCRSDTPAKVARTEVLQAPTLPDAMQDMQLSPANSIDDTPNRNPEQEHPALKNTVYQPLVDINVPQSMPQTKVIQVIELSDDEEDPLPTKSIEQPMMLETKTELAEGEEDRPCSNSSSCCVVETPETIIDVKTEADHSEIGYVDLNTGRGIEELNNSFIDDLMPMEEKPPIKSEALDVSFGLRSVVYGDDVITLDDDGGESLWQPSQLFSDTQVDCIKNELDVELAQCDEADEDPEHEDVQFHTDDGIIEIGSDSDEEGSVDDNWFQKLSQGNMKVEVKAEKVSDDEDMIDAAKTMEDSSEDDNCVPQQDAICKDLDSESESELYNITPPRSIPILTREQPTALEVTSPTKELSKVNRSSPPTLSPQRPLRRRRSRSRPIIESDDEDEPVIKPDKPAAEEEVPKKKSSLQKASHLIDALPMPHRRSNQRGISAQTANQLYQQNTEKRKEEEEREKLRATEEALEQERKVTGKKTKENAADETRDNELEAPLRVRKKRISSVGDGGLLRQKILPVVSETKSRQKKDSDESIEIAACSNAKKERAKKLSALAKKAKAEAEAQELEAARAKQNKIPGRVVMKMTTNNRAAKLAEAFVGEKIAPLVEPVLPDISSLPRIPKKPVASTSAEPSTSSHTPDHGADPKSVNKVPPVLHSTSRFYGLQQPSTSKDTNLKLRPAKSVPQPILKSCLRRKSLHKMKKRVTFNDKHLTSVKIFLVAKNASLNVVGSSKDLAFPKRRKSLRYSATEAYLEIVHDVCRWNPSWLNEQKQTERYKPPPVYGTEELTRMLHRFTSHSDYIKVVRPLMLLNLWASILKETSRTNPRQLSIGVDCVESHPARLGEKALSRITCHALLTHEEGHCFIHPRMGELVILELALETDRYSGNPVIGKDKRTFETSLAGSQSSTRGTMVVFAYVEHFTKRRYSPKSPHKVHVDLLTAVENPNFIINMILIIKSRPYVLRTTQIMRLKNVSYIRPTLRTFEALAILEHSPLRDIILFPKKEDYLLPEVDVKSYISTNAKGELNEKQAEAVLKILNACTLKKPKICMVQGPPGTGKSHVIVNLVTKLLGGLGRDERILLCAPSNAALDEIVLRLIVIRQSWDKKNRFNLVRCGRTSTMDPQVRLISVEELAKKDLQAKKESEQLQSVLLELNTLKAKLAKVNLELESAKENKRLNKNTLVTKIASYHAQIYNLERGRHVEKSPVEAQQERLESEKNILLKAHIIAVTLTSCNTAAMEKTFLHQADSNMFACCIVDEASQCSEPDTLLPLMLGVKALVLVGDPQQLPATTHCKIAKDLGFGESLLARLQRCFDDKTANPMMMLKEQYRMHPNIVRWPNEYFYENQLTSPLAFANFRSCPLLPYAILRHEFHQERNGKMINHQEAELICRLARCFSAQLPNLTLGVITPYADQRIKISYMLRDMTNIKVNTIDGFQGQERDVILISCVRTIGMGFMAEGQRLNVALTRAKYSLIVCVNFASLQNDAMWSAMLEDGIRRCVIRKIPSGNYTSSEKLFQLVKR